MKHFEILISTAVPKDEMWFVENFVPHFPGSDISKRHNPPKLIGKIVNLCPPKLDISDA